MPDDRVRMVYRLGGWAAASAVALVLAYGAVLAAYRIPGTVLGHFEQIDQHKLIGLLNLDLVMLISEVLLVAVYAALYAALREASRWLVTAASAVALTGIVLYVAVNPTFSFLYLSDQYAAASTPEQRASLLAAGEALWANYQGTAFGVSYLMAAVATLCVSAAMLRTAIFSRATAFTGLLFGAAMLIPPLPAFGQVGVVASYASLVPMIVFDALVAWRLLQMAGRRGDRRFKTSAG